MKSSAAAWDVRAALFRDSTACLLSNNLLNNTFFRLPTREKATWIHTQSWHWQLLDYVLVWRRDRQDVLLTKAIRDADGWTDNRLCQLRNVVQSTALKVLGRARRQHQDWFDDNDADISNLLVEKNGLHKAYMDLRTNATKAAFFRCRCLVQQRLREMQDAWMLRKAEDIQGSDGATLLTEKSKMLKRWAEHFRCVLNCSSAITDAAIDRLPQVDTNNELDLLPSFPETIRAVQQISSSVAPGSNAIPMVLYKHGGPRLMVELTTFFQEMWRQGRVPQDFKDATIVHLYKRKGNWQLCDNHRGIMLLNIAGKIFARILLNCLSGHLEQGLLWESQCGFRQHRWTTDTIFEGPAPGKPMWLPPTPRNNR
ncbi:unnamed protein product [Schistocephalus solidus]|uniref:Reverse transcriptase domain-containing protein n=1 Tax=Schistocephalus solidus TaxID=70667 RepID=A0A183SDQ7_SCHSO|nr:unnamed protein product [Schistocephalus solidus]